MARGRVLALYAKWRATVYGTRIHLIVEMEVEEETTDDEDVDDEEEEARREALSCVNSSYCAPCA
jgi:hypothetical protein